MAEEIVTATEYWDYIRAIVSKYVGRKDNNGKQIITSGSAQSRKD